MTHTVTRPHRHKVLERHAGQASHAQEHAAGVGIVPAHTLRGQAYTHSRMRTAAPSPLGPALKALGGSRRAWRVWVSFSTVSGPIRPTRSPGDPSSRDGADVRATQVKVAAATNWPKRQAGPDCACALGELRLARVPQEVQLPEGAALRLHSDLGPQRRCHGNYNSQKAVRRHTVGQRISAAPGARGGQGGWGRGLGVSTRAPFTTTWAPWWAGSVIWGRDSSSSRRGRSPQVRVKKTLRIREAK